MPIEDFRMTRTEILEVIEPLLQEPYFLVDVELSSSRGGPLVRIFLDTDDGITIDECAEWSRELGDVFDVRELFRGRYTLEVASPGLNRPLRLPRQYRKNIGRNLRLRVQTEESELTLTGRLLAVDEEEIRLELRDGERQVPFTSVLEARIEPEF